MSNIDPFKKVPNRIGELLDASNKTLKEISQETNINYGTLSAYKRQVRYPKKENAKILADYFGVSTPYLLGLDNKIPSKGGNNWGNKVKKLRKEVDKTMKEVSEETRIGLSTISSYENGYSTPKKENAKILADYFGVSIPYLLGLDDKGCTCNKVMRAKQVDQIKEHLAVIYERLSLINQLLNEE